jgi:hypothetical protein
VGLNQRAQEWSRRAEEWRKQSLGSLNTIQGVR